MQIELLRADVTSLKVDAVVNAQPAGAVAAGTATAVRGGNVLCKFVIHMALPAATERDAEAKLSEAVRAALRRGEELAIGSIAFPALCGQPFGFDGEQSARVMLRTALDFRPHARSLQRAVFCAFSEATYGDLARVLEELQR